MNANETKTYNCPECDFRNHMDNQYRAEGRTVRPRNTCFTCNGTGSVTVDPAAIKAALLNSRGKAKGTFRKSRPALPNEKNGVYGAAYVWRMIRFDNGMDMHLPMMALDYVGLIGSTSRNHADLRKHLDALVDLTGNEIFGKIAMMRGAARWGQALGFENADEVANLVASTVGLPMGNGYALGDENDSPEAALENHNVETQAFELPDGSLYVNEIEFP